MTEQHADSRSNYQRQQQQQQRDVDLRESELDRAVEPEYAAISGTAIIALLLAPLGLLSLYEIYFQMFNIPVPILLILPLVSLAVALAAIKSIRQSEGTRVGIRIASIAAVLSGLIFIGSGGYHVHHIMQESDLKNRLKAAALMDSQAIFTGRYNTIYSKMLLFSPEMSKEMPLQEWTSQMNDFLYGGGAYYGSRIEATRMFSMKKDEDDPNSPELLAGIVVRRLVFRNGSADLILNYVYNDGQWQLARAYAQAATEFGRMEDTPRPRWEEELTGGAAPYAPPWFNPEQDAPQAEQDEPQAESQPELQDAPQSEIQAPPEQQ